MIRELILAGFGGQGIMTMGTMLATAGMKEGLHVTWLPAYGAEQRGGTANCTVVVSDESIASPIVDSPGIVVAMNLPSLEKFGPRCAPGGLLFINSSLIERGGGRGDITEVRVPANDVAMRLGNPRVANMVMLGAVIGKTGLVKLETLEALFRESTKGKAREMAELNAAALAAGRDVALA
jgi:2-oxoglutarate ferredoxin oxidoreductase subunit gamma